MSFKLRTGEGIQSLDPNEIINALNGYYVVNGCEVSEASSGLEVDVDSGTVKVDDEEFDVDSGSVSLEDSDSDPRKDVVYVDDEGGLDVVTGSAEEASPSDDDRFDTAKPSPNSFRNINGTPLAEVWVGADATDLSSDDVRDRRIVDPQVGGDSGSTGLTFDSQHIQWNEGTSDEEVFRKELGSGETFSLSEIDLKEKGGGSTDSDFFIEVVDESDNDNVLGSCDLNDRETFSDVESTEGATILFKITNDVNDDITGCFAVKADIE